MNPALLVLSSVSFPLCCVCAQSLNHVRPFAASWTMASQAPLSLEFSKQDFWNGVPFSPPGNLPYPGVKPASLASPSLTGRFFTASTTWEALSIVPLHLKLALGLLVLEINLIFYRHKIQGHQLHIWMLQKFPNPTLGFCT